jgi:hypothetical protein
MNISDMNLETALHYHSSIIYMIIGFFTVVGVAITLIWTTFGKSWSDYMIFKYGLLIVFFIEVMYSIFLIDLGDRIFELNIEEKNTKKV